MDSRGGVALRQAGQVPGFVALGPPVSVDCAVHLQGDTQNGYSPMRACPLQIVPS